MSNIKKVYYIGPFSFPDGGAAARRILGNIESLNQECIVIDGKDEVLKSSYQGIEIISCAERPNKESSFLTKLKKYFNISKNTISYINEQEELPDTIILYSGYSPYLFRLIPFCKKNNIKLIFDCVEWYQPKSKIEYLYKPYYWNIELSMRYLLKKCDYIICISKYLENYYKASGSGVVRIPPTIKFNKNIIPVPNEIENNKIKLVYAGNPGHKDLLNDIIEAINGLEDYFELHIVGVSGVNQKSIYYYGYLPHYKSLNIVKSCHFSILLRPNNKVSNAGFSTKIVESMCNGIPVIANNTGDIKDFVNKENGFLFEGEDSSALHVILKKISNISDANYNKLSKNAFMTAVDFFHIDCYKKVLRDIVS
ncbi:hypothetical protein SKA34_20025 [Photobacterium sp. SKA34]|uniref:glycosyltransferase n=1 Tax=Photobacterium sp. SKA34 TaxID=121723 RepID=UPI00006ACD10|nr:glycosyltransferase [Photobacterium sp. SKA34]EAR56470.1 hypothetical protein SKA34_20025 [Photobacterium sp. SKA34]